MCRLTGAMVAVNEHFLGVWCSFEFCGAAKEVKLVAIQAEDGGHSWVAYVEWHPWQRAWLHVEGPHLLCGILKGGNERQNALLKSLHGEHKRPKAQACPISASDPALSLGRW